jgi:hypothetical protein
MDKVAGPSKYEDVHSNVKNGDELRDHPNEHPLLKNGFG